MRPNLLYFISWNILSVWSLKIFHIGIFPFLNTNKTLTFSVPYPGLFRKGPFEQTRFFTYTIYTLMLPKFEGSSNWDLLKELRKPNEKYKYNHYFSEFQSVYLGNQSDERLLHCFLTWYEAEIGIKNFLKRRLSQRLLPKLMVSSIFPLKFSLYWFVGPTIV